MEQQHKRSAFSGKIGFVLSAAGASVGLGNIWRSRIWQPNTAAAFSCWYTFCWQLPLVIL